MTTIPFFLGTLTIFILCILPSRAAGVLRNVTIVNHDLMSFSSFSSGWRIVPYPGTTGEMLLLGQEGHSVIDIRLPGNTVAVYLLGLKDPVSRSQFVACLDCTDESSRRVELVNAYDSNDDDLQPTVLASFVELDGETPHNLRIATLRNTKSPRIMVMLYGIVVTVQSGNDEFAEAQSVPAVYPGSAFHSISPIDGFSFANRHGQLPIQGVSSWQSGAIPMDMVDTIAAGVKSSQITDNSGAASFSSVRPLRVLNTEAVTFTNRVPDFIAIPDDASSTGSQLASPDTPSMTAVTVTFGPYTVVIPVTIAPPSPSSPIPSGPVTLSSLSITVTASPTSIFPSGATTSAPDPVSSVGSSMTSFTVTPSPTSQATTATATEIPTILPSTDVTTTIPLSSSTTSATSSSPSTAATTSFTGTSSSSPSTGSPSSSTTTSTGSSTIPTSTSAAPSSSTTHPSSTSTSALPSSTTLLSSNSASASASSTSVASLSRPSSVKNVSSTVTLSASSPTSAATSGSSSQTDTLSTTRSSGQSATVTVTDPPQATVTVTDPAAANALASNKSLSTTLIAAVAVLASLTFLSVLLAVVMIVRNARKRKRSFDNIENGANMITPFPPPPPITRNSYTTRYFGDGFVPSPRQFERQDREGVDEYQPGQAESSPQPPPVPVRSPLRDSQFPNRISAWITRSPREQTPPWG